jgi:queuosine biosynthesis protein QueC
MCTIGGFLSKDPLTKNDVKEFRDFMKRLLTYSIDRGRDSIGMATYNKYTDQFINQRATPKNAELFIKQMVETQIVPGITKGLYNNLGLPTTEYFEDEIRNIQPFSTSDLKIEENWNLIDPERQDTTKYSGDYTGILVHNGLLSNDEVYLPELMNNLDKLPEYNQKSLENLENRVENGDKLVDSYALLAYFRSKTKKMDENYRFLDMTTDLSNISNEIFGGYSFGYMDRDHFIIGRNHVDLNAMKLYINGKEILVFSTKKEYLKNSYLINDKDILHHDISLEKFEPNIKTIKPYTMHIFNTSDKYKDRNNYEIMNININDNKDKAVVIFSGGLDSTTVSTIACNENKDITLLNFKYGCHAETREEKQARKVYESLKEKFPNKNINLKYFETDLFSKIGGSSLLEDDSDNISYGQLGVETKNEWVPARNLVFISIVTAYCEANNIGKIYLGLNLEEQALYPDNSSNFYEDLNTVLSHVSPVTPVIVNPLVHKMKHEIVKTAYEIGAPINHSWSCYHGKYEYSCGNCGPCYMRKKSHEIEGLPESIKYMDDEIVDLYNENKLTKEQLTKWGVTREKDLDIIFKNNYKHGNMHNKIIEWYKNN